MYIHIGLLIVSLWPALAEGGGLGCKVGHEVGYNIRFEDGVGGCGGGDISEGGLWAEVGCGEGPKLLAPEWFGSWKRLFFLSKGPI